jgi:hypothetical protein
MTPNRAVPDHLLLEQVAAGEVAAVRELSARYRGILCRRAAEILTDEAEAERLVGTAFRQLRYEAARFDPAQFPVRRWLNEVIEDRAFAVTRTRAALAGR